MITAMTLLVALALTALLVAATVRAVRSDRRAPSQRPPASRFVDPAFLPPSARI